MADKIVVLNAGHIEQYGSPLELYERPANLFVAGFIGSPKMNFVSGEAAGEPGVATLGIRPEHLKIGKEGEGWPGTVSVAEHLGSDTFLYVDAGKLGMLTARCIGEFNLKAGDRVWLSPDPARLHRFDKDGAVDQDVSGTARRRRRSQVNNRKNKKMYLEKFKLDRKTAVVTGAGQGIGLACAEALAEAGAKVVIADRDPAIAETGCASLKAKGLDAEIVIMDVTDSRARLRGRRSTGVALRRRSISSSTMPALREARRRPRRSPTNIGSTSSTSISTARSGAAAPSASTCWTRSPVPS